MNIEGQGVYEDMTDINGHYDLIIAKSVLGGIFRNNESNIEDVNKLIQKILEKNINHGGMLILEDNGKSFFEKMLVNFGSRKNNWRFFNASDFKNPDQQFTFGFLSCFSYETRFGFFGTFIDYMLYISDLLLSKVTNHPTVILTVFFKK